MQVIAKVSERLERVITEEQPDGVIIYGDTNSTLAGAIVASKCRIPLFHVEAGPRTYNRTNPEEQNRIVADHLSDYLFTPDRISVENLKKEGIASDRIIFSGDVMYDEFLHTIAQTQKERMRNEPEHFILMTWHRQENTCSRERMERMLSFIRGIACDIVLPLHPGTKRKLVEYGLWEQAFGSRHLHIKEPVGYKEMMALINSSRLIISDSGGVSKEASFAGKKCFFPLNLVVWPELVQSGHISIVDIENMDSVRENQSRIESLLEGDAAIEKTDFFGTGNAAEIVVGTIKNILHK